MIIPANLWYDLNKLSTFDVQNKEAQQHEYQLVLIAKIIGCEQL